MSEIMAQINLAETYSQLEFCRDDFQKRFLSVFCPMQDEEIIKLADKYHDLVFEKDELIRGPQTSEF